MTDKAIDEILRTYRKAILLDDSSIADITAAHSIQKQVTLGKLDELDSIKRNNDNRIAFDPILDEVLNERIAALQSELGEKV